MKKADKLIVKWRDNARALTKMAKDGNGSPDRASQVACHNIAQTLRQCAKELREALAEGESRVPDSEVKNLGGMRTKNPSIPRTESLKTRC